MVIAKKLYRLSNRALIWLEKIVPQKYREVIESVRIDKFIQETDFNSLECIGWPVCIIDRGEWEYPLFQMSFLSNMLANVVDCLSRGYLPMVDFKTEKEGINLWEQFLNQPYKSERAFAELTTAKRYAKERGALFFPKAPTAEDVDKYSKLISNLVVLNDETQSYIKTEYEKILSGKSVLGVLCRGTDYTSNKPKGHPVQPSIEELIDLVKEKIVELDCDWIYLATEENHILQQFEAVFPGKILTNERRYYDEFYTLKEKSGDATRISWVHSDRENDNYYKSLEYLSSLMLLSKCDALIAGNCGGSRAALYFNQNKYRYVYLFDIGMY